MGRGRDQIDKLCEDWAHVRRELLGLTEPLTAAGYVGAVRCTLSARRDLHAGSRSFGRVDQHYPEVYLGDTALVNAAWHNMPVDLKSIMDWHYCVTVPRDKRRRADLMGITRAQYWERLGRAKAFVDGSLAIVESVRTQIA